MIKLAIVLGVGVTVLATAFAQANANEITGVAPTQKPVQMQISDNKIPVNPPKTTPVTEDISPKVGDNEGEGVSSKLTPVENQNVATNKKVSTPVVAQASGPVTENVQQTSLPTGTCVGNEADGGGDACEFNPNGALSKDPTPSDPERPYFDLWGNEFTYDGQLMHISTECVDPISNEPNPYCSQ